MKLINNKLIVLSATVGMMCMTHVTGQEIEENDLIETVDTIQELDQEPIIVDDSLDQIDVEPVSSDFEEKPILDVEYQASFSEDGGIQLGDQISFGIEDGSENIDVIEEEIPEEKPVETVESVEEELIEEELIEEEPIKEEPIKEEPVEKEPVEEEPVEEEPVEEEPVEEEPIEEEPVEEEPVEEEPIEEEPVMLDSEKEIIEEPELCPFMVHPDNSISEIPAFEGENCSIQIAACSLEGFNLCPDDTVCTNMPVSSSISYRCDPIVMEQLEILVEEEPLVEDEKTLTKEEIPVETEIEELVKEEEEEKTRVAQEPSVVEEQNEIPVVTRPKQKGNNCGLLRMLLFTNNDADFFTKFLLFQSYKNSC